MFLGGSKVPPKSQVFSGAKQQQVSTGSAQCLHRTTTGTAWATLAESSAGLGWLRFDPSPARPAADVHWLNLQPVSLGHIGRTFGWSHMGSSHGFGNYRLGELQEIFPATNMT